jgi:hypothetical protein
MAKETQIGGLIALAVGGLIGRAALLYLVLGRPIALIAFTSLAPLLTNVIVIALSISMLAFIRSDRQALLAPVAFGLAGAFGFILVRFAEVASIPGVWTLVLNIGIWIGAGCSAGLLKMLVSGVLGARTSTARQ